ncbi:putative Mce family protein [Gordonia crocea]|uniref:Putative Mce family protein n=2 Tax=Gordonia crocea TaxID=589162 RepID=A0A7I9UYH7_9ACTN|nr:MCE family protein [Gordonia crocea]GED98247.1 putative Mce family protein [Gordonia crocea]
MNVKSMYREKPQLVTGVIGALVLVLILVAVFVLAGANIGKRGFDADFAQAGGIRPGDKVRVAGIDVGEVTGTKLARDHVKVSMKIDRKVDVRSNGTAEIKMSTLLGQRYVDVVLGDAPDKLEDNRFGIANTRVPYDLQKTIEAGTPILAGINPNDLTNSLTQLNRQLAGTPALARPAIDGLARMSEVITSRKDQLNQLIKDTKTVTAVVDDSQVQLAMIIGQGQQLATKISTREALVTRLLDGLAALTRHAQAIGAQNAGQFAPMLANIQTISQGLEKNRANLRKLLEILPITARATVNIMADGPYANGYLPWGLFPDNWLCTARVVDGC